MTLDDARFDTPKSPGIDEWLAHAELYDATDGREGATRNGEPVVVITTTGARTGEARKTPVLKLRYGDRYLLIASLGGADRHPNWYRNVVATPVITVQDGAVRQQYRARELHGAQRSEWWDRAVADQPVYADYERKTSRVIPVILLEPAADRLVPDGMDSTDALLAIEQIKQLKARYFRLVDTKQWATLESLFTPDCTFEFASSLPSVGVRGYESAADFVRTVSVRQADTVVSHHGHMPEVTLIDADRALGIWAMEDILQRPAGGIPSFHGWGHYHERYSRIDGAWKISAVRLTRLRERRIADLPAP
jgi:deazaflavin-dependent oxidoreductase (nitroreductase family)